MAETETAAGGQAAEGTAAPAATVADGGDKAPQATNGKAQTLAENGGGEEQKPGAATWPEDWRQRWAGDDEKRQQRLNRFKSPEGFAKSYFELEKKLSEKAAGPAKPGKDATPEDIAAYREAIGVPEKPEGYLEAVTLPDGWTLGDDDKPVALSYAAAMHQVHAPQEVIDQGLGWYKQHMEGVMATQVEADAAFKQASRDALRDKWGPEFNLHINAIPATFADAPEGLFNDMLTARYQNGQLLGNDPRFIEHFSMLGSERNPTASIMPIGQQTGQGITEEIKAIEQLMASPDAPEKYWRDEAKQARYRQLLDARDKLNQRAA